MASGTYNAGSNGINDGSILLLTDTIELLLLDADAAYTFDPDHATVAAILAAGSELDASGYVGGHAGAGRRVLAGKTVTNDTTNNRSVFDATDPATWTLGAGKTAVAAVVFKRGASDAASIPLFFLDYVDVPTNGGTFQLQFHADGIAYVQNG